MYTQCPHCLTLFEVEPDQLAQARGQLCCGACGQAFDGLERLAERPEAVGESRDPAPVPPRVDPIVDPLQADLFVQPGVAATEPAAAAASAAVSPDSSDSGAARSAPAAPTAATTSADHAEFEHATASEAAGATTTPPSFVRRHRSARRRAGGLAWLAAAVALGALLALQIALAQRHELAADARFRPALEHLCGTLGCDLPPWRDPDRLQVIDRGVVPHPSTADALLVTATIRNDAPWPQAWPMLELTLSDLEGEPVAMRRFRPEEYLGAAPERPLLGSGETVLARLELADPGKQAVAFGFEFR